MADLSDIVGRMMDRNEQDRQYANAAMMRQQQHEQDMAARSLTAISNDKNDLLKDPGKLERAVANMSDFYSPTASTKKPKGESYGVDTVEASKDSSDPTRGYGTTLRDAFAKDLMAPEYAHVPAGQLLQERARQLMETPQADGRSLIEKSHEFARMEKSRWFGGVKTKPLPGYSAWEADKQNQERTESDRESWLATPHDMAVDTAIGAAFGLSAGMLGSGTAGALAGAGMGAALGAAFGGPLAPITAPIGGVLGGVGGYFGGSAVGAAAGAATGAAVGLGGSILAAPIRKMVHKTDWYQSKIASPEWSEKTKAILADMAAYLPGGMIAGKGVSAAEGAAKSLGGMEGVLDQVGKSSEGMIESIGRGGPKYEGPPGGGGVISSSLKDGSSSRLDYAGTNKRLNELDGGISSEPLNLPGNVSQPSPVISASTEISKLLGTGGKSQAWGLQEKPLLREEVPPDVSISKTQLPENITETLLSSTVGVKTDVSSSPAPASLTTDRTQRYSLLDRALRDAKDAETISTALDITTKAKESIIAKPTAANIMKEVDSVSTVIKDLKGSELAITEEALSPKGRKEAGTDSIDPMVDTDVVKLDGVLEDSIKNAKARDDFVRIGMEPEGGELRSQIASKSEGEMKAKFEEAAYKPFVEEGAATSKVEEVKVSPIEEMKASLVEEPKVKTPVTEPIVPAKITANTIVDDITKVDAEVVPTPKQQEKAIANVEIAAKGGKHVIEETFPEAKPLAEAEVMDSYFNKELEGETLEGLIEKTKKQIMESESTKIFMNSNFKSTKKDKVTGVKTVTERPRTAKEKNTYLKEKLDDELEIHNDAFRMWADDAGVALPEHMAGPDFELFKTTPLTFDDVGLPTPKGEKPVKLSKKQIVEEYYKVFGVNNREERVAQLEERAVEILNSLKQRSKFETVRTSKITPEELMGQHEALIAKDDAGLKKWVAGKKEKNVNTVNPKLKLIAGMTALSVPMNWMYTSMSGEGQGEAQAGMITDVLKGVVGAVKVSAETAAKKAALVAESARLGYVARSVEKGQTVLGSNNLQHGIIMKAEDSLKIVHENLRKGTGAGVQYSLMSPYQAMEALFKTAAGKLINPAVHLASFVTAGARNRDNALRVATNILSEANIKGVPNQVKEATTHLVPLGAKAAEADVTNALLKSATTRLENFTAKLAKATSEDEIVAFNADIAGEQQNIGKLKANAEKLGTAVKDYHDNWTATMQKLSNDPVMGPSVRVSLALEDPTRTLYPWLKGLTRGEEVAVGKLRGLSDQYQVRLKERGIGTLDNYLHHAPHPEMSKLYASGLEDLLGGAPFQKFFSRTENSKALLPDISYTMNHYITDIEPRLQNHDFWKRSGWDKVRESTVVQANPGLKRAFDNLYEGAKPVEQTWGNIAASKYSEFEAVQKLFLSPSAGLKHLVKMSADIASVGPSVWAKSLPETAGYLTRKLLNRTWGVNPNSIRDGLAKFGIKSDRFGRQIMDDYMDSAIMSGNMRKYMMDMGVESQEQIFNSAKKLWDKTQDVGSVWINLAELADRATSVSSALQMAGKKGMTVDQAMYGTYDLILKNNFLFGQFNPSWLRNPKIRAFLMFQATPFKIFERRGVVAQRALMNTNQLSSGLSEMLTTGMDKSTATTIQKMFGSVEGRAKVKADLFNMNKYMREGQSELKSNLFIDTLRQETDFFGTPIMRQLLTDIVTVGAMTYGGAQAGMSLSDHFFHVPFVSTQSKEGHPEFALSPLASGVLQGIAAWKAREPNEDFQLKKVTDRWLGKDGPLPMTLQKIHRLSTDDIPEIYQKGGDSGYLKYFFGVPGHE